MRTPRRLPTRATTTSLLIVAGLLAAVAAAADPVENWRLLDTIEIREKVDGDLWEAIKTYPEPLRAAAEGFEIEGFVVPVQAQPYVTTFLLVEDPDDCPFCGGNAGYGPVIEVHMRRPLPDMPQFTLIRLVGDLEFNTDPETMQTVRMVDARPL